VDDQYGIQYGREVMRLRRLAVEHSGEQLLDAALEGREKTADNAVKLCKFVERAFGPATGTPGEASPTTKKFRDVVGAFLMDVAGIEEKKLDAILDPFPGVTGSILDEFDLE
jgi:hypothetical protein